MWKHIQNIGDLLGGKNFFWRSHTKFVWAKQFFANGGRIGQEFGEKWGRIGQEFGENWKNFRALSRD